MPLNLLEGLGVLAVYLLLGRAIGEINWRVWHRQWTSPLLRMVAFLCFPLSACADGGGDSSEREGGGIIALLRERGRLDGDRDAYLFILVIFWPFKIIWNLATICVIALWAFVLFVVLAGTRRGAASLKEPDSSKGLTPPKTEFDLEPNADSRPELEPEPLEDSPLMACRTWEELVCELKKMGEEPQNQETPQTPSKRWEKE